MHGNGLKQNVVITARKRSLGQGNIFSSVCQEFCPQGGLPQCMLGYHPLARRPPWQGRPPSKADHPPLARQTPHSPLARRPPGKAGPPGKAEPPGKTEPPGKDTPHPPGKETPLHSTCWEIRSTSGRYASYWNAILLIMSLISLIITKSCKVSLDYELKCHSFAVQNIINNINDIINDTSFTYFH